MNGPIDINGITEHPNVGKRSIARRKAARGPARLRRIASVAGKSRKDRRFLRRIVRAARKLAQRMTRSRRA